MNDALSVHLDHHAIIDTTIRYTWLLDHGPREKLTTVFTPDAYALLGRDCDGVEAIIARVKEALDPLDSSQHIVSNHQVSIHGDTATCRCYFQAQHVKRGTEGGDNYMVAGRYTDNFVRTAEGWRIEHRTLTVDWVDGNDRVVRG